MKGFVPTPPATVELMVGKLFQEKEPAEKSRLLDPGCGKGAFIEGVIRWCVRQRISLPRIIGIDSDPRHIADAREKFSKYPSIKLILGDFLTPGDLGPFDFIIGNPPYVPITGLSPSEKSRYRNIYQTAQGRFDLYLLFFEQALKYLGPDGRLVFITPEKYLYTDTAASLRRLLSHFAVQEIHLQHEDTFQDLVTYPTITTVTNCVRAGKTSVILRDGTIRCVNLPSHGTPWWPAIHQDDNGQVHSSEIRLGDICRRLSCGVATGADAVFVRKTEELPAAIRKYAYPTIAGRELVPSSATLPTTRYSMLVPYASEGQLLKEHQLGALKQYLEQKAVRDRLLKRTCVSRKPWYAFHESPPLKELLRPKILCKDITPVVRFWADRTGLLVPRHSVYYLVPEDPGKIEELLAYLNSNTARAWLFANCQRAANGFLRLQSHVLKRLPVPPELAPPGAQLRGLAVEVA